MSGKRIHWTTEEEMELRRIYALPTAGQSSRAIDELAKAKGCSTRNCRARAAQLGLVRIAGGHRRWTDVELENLRHYAGRLSVKKISRILGRSFDAVATRLSLLELSGRVKERGYTREELADLLGVDRQHTLKALLQRFPMPTNLLGNFAESEVQLWVWDHLEELELRKMNQSWLKAILRRAA